MATGSVNTPYIIITGTVVIAIVIVFTVLQPILGEIQSLNGQITTTNSVVTEKENFLRGLDRKREELQVQRVHEDRLNVILPNEDGYDELTRAISLAATNAGLVVQKVENKSTAAQSTLNGQRARGEVLNVPGGVSIVAAEVDLIGTYQQIRAFLDNLEKSPRLTDVLRISSKAVEGTTDQITTKVFIQSYFREQ